MGNRMSIKIDNKVNSPLKVTVEPLGSSAAETAEYRWEIKALSEETKGVDAWNKMKENVKFKATVQGQDGNAKWTLLHLAEVDACDLYVVTSEEIQGYVKPHPAGYYFVDKMRSWWYGTNTSTDQKVK